MPINIDVEPVLPVLLVLPDTVKTTGFLTASFTIYNAGSSTLPISVAARDPRCIAACTITFASAPVAPGATSPVRIVAPQDFAPGLLSFVVRSAQGDVVVYWQLTSLQIP
jgi:hypothetical protein